MEKQSSVVETPNRLHRLTDIIFALSMVMFIISGMLTFNDESFWSGYDLDPQTFVLERVSELFTSFLVFLFMAIYWFTNSNQSKYIVKVDKSYTWINIFYLFFIAIAPFPNALSIRFSSDFYVQAFFSLDMFFIGLFSYWAWYYASKNHRLINSEVTAIEIKAITREMIVEPLVAIITLAASFVSVLLWEPSLMLLPIGMVIISVINRRAKQK
jgi:uncharacterized membrane protein